MLRVVISNLPLDAALEVFRFLPIDEQHALGNVLFGRIVTWRRDVRRGKVQPEQAEKIQRLVAAIKTENGNER
jgi:hypothetical protein